MILKVLNLLFYSVFYNPVRIIYNLPAGYGTSAMTSASSVSLAVNRRLCGIGTGDDFFPCNNSAISLTNNILLCIEDSPSSEVSSLSSRQSADFFYPPLPYQSAAAP